MLYSAWLTGAVDQISRVSSVSHQGLSALLTHTTPANVSCFNQKKTASVHKVLKQLFLVSLFAEAAQTQRMRRVQSEVMMCCWRRAPGQRHTLLTSFTLTFQTLSLLPRLQTAVQILVYTIKGENYYCPLLICLKHLFPSYSFIVYCFTVFKCSFCYLGKVVQIVIKRKRLNVFITQFNTMIKV